MSVNDRTSILVVGGGVAALEALLALRALAGEQPHLRLLAPDRDFVLRATAVLEPFGRGHARRIPLSEAAADMGAELVSASIASVDAAAKTVTTTDGDELDYDVLVVALGALAEQPFPGAVMFAGPQDAPAFLEVLGEAERGEIEHLAFTLPPGMSWPLPLYELALLTSAHLADRGGPPVEISVVTPEERPLEVFGTAAADDLEALLATRGIRLRTLSRPRAHEGEQLLLAGGGRVRADRVIALPRLIGRALEGLPQDDLGYIPVDDHGRVAGAPDVYAAGDCTAFPMKQGGLAAQQADTVAATIANALGAGVEAEPFRPVLRGLLLTGSTPSYFRATPGSGREPTTVAIDAPLPGREAAMPSVAAHRPLWWPPSKVAGRYLGAWLANTGAPGMEAGTIEDRDAPDADATRAADEERDAALDLALMMADGEAKYGDWHAALRALDAAEALTGSLPSEYVQKRDVWLAELHGTPGPQISG